MKRSKLNIQVQLMFFVFIFSAFLFQSCSNLFINPQPINVKDEHRIPKDFHGIFKTRDNDLKIEIGLNFINTEERQPFKDIKKVYFTKNDLEYVISNGKECQIYDVKFNNDSVFGKVINRNEFKLNTNLVYRNVKDYHIFNFKLVGDSWSPIFVNKEGNYFYSYELRTEILDKFPKNSKEYITKDFDEEDVIYFFKRPKEFLEPHIKFDKNSFEIKQFTLD
jgi:hypothetical protein